MFLESENDYTEKYKRRVELEQTHAIFLGAIC